MASCLVAVSIRETLSNPSLIGQQAMTVLAPRLQLGAEIFVPSSWQFVWTLHRSDKARIAVLCSHHEGLRSPLQRALHLQPEHHERHRRVWPAHTKHLVKFAGSHATILHSQ